MYLKKTHLLIPPLLIPAPKSPNLLTQHIIKQIKHPSLILHIPIHQRPIFQTTHNITTHHNPTYTKHPLLHYPLPNIPRPLPPTSTIPFNNPTLPYPQLFPNKPYPQPFKLNHPLSLPLNTFNPHLTNNNLAHTFNFQYTSIQHPFK
ncbi:Rossmann-fold NAD(P)-binding domain-containing protein [Staphylococcus epidermidis]|uniref:hypothetical protein n=1 Tax=Staphylococcus epidermidis TaxID=1282 RepID=UPI0011A8B48C